MMETVTTGSVSETMDAAVMAWLCGNVTQIDVSVTKVVAFLIGIGHF